MLDMDLSQLALRTHTLVRVRAHAPTSPVKKLTTTAMYWGWSGFVLSTVTCVNLFPPQNNSMVKALYLHFTDAETGLSREEACP